MKAIVNNNLQRLIFSQTRKGKGKAKPQVRRMDPLKDFSEGLHQVLMVNKDNEPFLVTVRTAESYLKDIQSFKESGGDPNRHRRMRDGIRAATREEVDWFIDQVNKTGQVPNYLAGGGERKASTIIDLQAERIRQLEAQLAQGTQVPDNEHPIQEMPVIQEKPEAVAPEPEPEKSEWPKGFIPPYMNPENGGQKTANTRALKKWQKKQAELAEQNEAKEGGKDA